ncbi:MAG: hypothetical protein M4579_003541 [Chaenotheca gracillima]|nr:MAG: hypothetical protein M4579_003541 [Chaenotheca gracillima]
MLFDAEDEGALKKWIVKRLEDISDADSDVLADYVLALLRHESPETEVRKLCIEQLEDFLQDNTAGFVDDIFTVIRTKAFDGAAAQQTPILPVPPGPNGAPSTSSGALPGHPNVPAPLDLQNGGAAQSRKRSYNEVEGKNGRESYSARGGPGDRAFKQARRGSFRGGNVAGRGARQSPAAPLGRGQDMNMGNNGPGLAQSPPQGFPGMPAPPPGFPFDMNDPLPAFMAMQAMGFPPLPGLPPFPQAGSPTGFGAQNQPGGGDQRRTGPKIAEKCKDYEQKGFCALGNTCPYQHGPDHMIVPESTEEYDPSNAMMLDTPNAGQNERNGHRPQDGNRGGEFSRGRGRGRGGGGGFVPGRKGRADFSQAGPNHDRSITTVVVENIPEDKFDESTVREFFSTFGTVQDIQMQAYKRLALVKYEDYASARRAYDSPKVIFDNRFVKVYWYKPDAAPSANGHGKAGSPTASQRPESPQVDMEEVRRRQDELQKAHEEKMKKIKEAENSKLELEKRREELLKSQAEEKRKLMERIAAKTANGRVGSHASPTPPVGAETTTGTSENGETKKTSSQTEALRAQLAALEAEAQSLGIDASTTGDDGYSYRGRGRGRPFARGRGSYVPRGRGYDPYRGGYRGRAAASFGRGGGGRGGGAYKLDNRTKKVAVSGVEFDENRDEGLRQYLLGVGEFEHIEQDPDRRDSQLITFKDRFTAEKFFYGTTEIPSVGKVEVSWVNTPLPPVTLPAPNAASPSAGTSSMDKGGDESMQDPGMAGGDDSHKNEDYDVAEEDDDRWMVE